MGNRRNILLYPLSVIWRMITGFRNFLYDSKILRSFGFNIPVICVGNITVGGTGKTPHSEYLINLLKDEYNVALLSRGYRRKTKDFLLARPESSLTDTGDEPLQISRKFPGITVAVDRDRVNGIKKILEYASETDVIILDDGFQHRRITPGLSIVLSDFNRLITGDHLLPYGDLRESKSNIKRADILLVTKTPRDLTESDMNLIEKDIVKYTHQKLFFTTYRYKEPLPVIDQSGRETGLTFTKENVIVLVTGIANPKPLYDHLSLSCKEIIHLRYNDHHNFTKKDIEKIRHTFDCIKADRKYVLTTEKDAVRFRECDNITEPLSSALYFIPVEPEFLNKKDEFDKIISDYVGKNKRNN